MKRPLYFDESTRTIVTYDPIHRQYHIMFRGGHSLVEAGRTRNPMAKKVIERLIVTEVTRWLENTDFNELLELVDKKITEQVAKMWVQGKP